MVSLGPTMEADAHPELRDAYHEGMRELVAAAGGRLRALSAGACLEGFAGACVSAQAVVAGLGELPDELAEAGQVLFVHPGPPATGAGRRSALVAAPPRLHGADAGGLLRLACPGSRAAFGPRRHLCHPRGRRAVPAGAPARSQREDVPSSPRVYLETSSYGPRALRLCLEASGPEQIVFGSDVPVIDADVTLQAVAAVGDDLLTRARSSEPGEDLPLSTVPTPLEPAPPSLGRGRPLFLKREDVHELGAFKWRGALPVLTAYRDGGAATVVTASTGNHGAATAWAAERLGLQAVVYAPEGATQAKVDLIRGLGAEIRLVGADLDAAKEAAAPGPRDARGLPFFEDGAEPAQYEGYGAIADEILDQLDEPPAAVIVPVGNGALLGGIGQRRARVRRDAPGRGRREGGARHGRVLAGGHAVTSERSATFADGLAVRVAIPLAVDVLGEVASRMLLVSEREMAHAVGAYARAGIRVEGAAGAGTRSARRSWSTSTALSF